MRTRVSDMFQFWGWVYFQCSENTIYWISSKVIIPHIWVTALHGKIPHLTPSFKTYIVSNEYTLFIISLIISNILIYWNLTHILKEWPCNSQYWDQYSLLCENEIPKEMSSHKVLGESNSHVILIQGICSYM